MLIFFKINLFGSCFFKLSLKIIFENIKTLFWCYMKTIIDLFI